MNQDLITIAIEIGRNTFKGGDQVEYAPNQTGWRLRGSISNRQPLQDDFLVILPPSGEPQILISRDEGKSWELSGETERSLRRIHCENSMVIVNKP